MYFEPRASDFIGEIVMHSPHKDTSPLWVIIKTIETEIEVALYTLLAMFFLLLIPLDFVTTYDS